MAVNLPSIFTFCLTKNLRYGAVTSAGIATAVTPHCWNQTWCNAKSRFAVNSVTAGNYEYPVKIASFVTELNKGFRLLNLKNDLLRKRFDALKYDLKKVEEVVYDLSIRGMKPENKQDDNLGGVPVKK